MVCIFLKYKSKGAKSVCIGRNLETLVGTILEAIYSFFKCWCGYWFVEGNRLVLIFYFWYCARIFLNRPFFRAVF